MKIIINSYKSLFLIVGVIFLLNFTSCKEAKFLTYSEKNAIYFPSTDAETGEKGIDTSYVSFFHNPGMDALRIPYVVYLIGDLLDEDKEYKLEIIDSMTTALPDEFSLPEKLLFKKGTPVDTLYITIHKKDRLNTADAKVAFQIVENDNFKLGYENLLRIKLRFDNIVSLPPWWDDSIEYVYLGKFSVAKYNLFIQISGRSSIEGLEAWELRRICLQMKDYIVENSVTEDDGSPMVIVCY